MRRVCSWCGAELEPTAEEPSTEGLELLGIEGEPISHGLCDWCREQMDEPGNDHVSDH